MMKVLPMLLLFGLGSSCALRGFENESPPKILKASDIEWEKLNPARGDKSPQAGTLWGNRKGKDVPTGFLVKFVDGFSSPAHIHNETYRGVVISGLVHNDDPKAEHMWMPQGSYWTQPKGESHITAAKGKTNIAFIEIESAPYLVKPASQAFDSGERPVNIDATNIVWVNSKNSRYVKNKEVQISYLWGSPQKNKLNGTLLKIPAGFEGKIKTKTADIKAVVIKGEIRYKQNTQDITLKEGSLFSSKGAHRHYFSNKSSTEVLIYVRSTSTYLIK